MWSIQDAPSSRSALRGSRSALVALNRSSSLRRGTSRDREERWLEVAGGGSYGFGLNFLLAGSTSSQNPNVAASMWSSSRVWRLRASVTASGMHEQARCEASSECNPPFDQPLPAYTKQPGT